MSLTLTDVPTKSFGPVIDALLLFLSQCARQEQRLKRAAKSHYRAPQCLSGIRTFRLEFMREAEAERGEGAGSRAGPSVSGDRDADEFLAQSMGDFSFFAEEQTPASIPNSVLDNGASASASGLPAGASRRPSVTGSVSSLQRTTSRSSMASIPDNVEVRDVVAELKQWRQTEEGKNWGGKLELVRG